MRRRNARDLALILAGLVLLTLPLYGGLLGHFLVPASLGGPGAIARATQIAAYLPAGSGPEIAVPGLSFAECRANRNHRLSPDGRVCAVVQHALFLATPAGRRSHHGWVKWTRWHGWTDDSRFGVYEQYDQYGNSQGWVFDANGWSHRELSQVEACFGQMGGGCREGVLALASGRSIVMLKNGTVIDLASGTSHPLVTAATGTPTFAAWSPGESQLIWIAIAPDGVATLFIATGDGTGASAVGRIDPVSVWEIRWTPDRAVMTAGGRAVTLDRHAGRLVPGTPLP